MESLAALLSQETSDLEQKTDAPQTPMGETPQKKKSKKSGAAYAKKLLAKAAEEARLQLIKQKQELLKETKGRVQSEWEANHAKAPIFENEFRERIRLLENSVRKFTEMKESWEEYKTECRKQKQWSQYVNCHGLPHPQNLPALNTYIHFWKNLNKDCLADQCTKKAAEVTELLKGLEDTIKDPGPDHSPHFIRDLKEIRAEIRNLLQEHINKTTYCLLSNIGSNMVSINVTTSKYGLSCPQFDLRLWAELITPIPSKKNEIRKPWTIDFDDIKLTATLPSIMLDFHKAVRVMLLYYDHWSDKCRSYECPPPPAHYSMNMYELVTAEFDSKVEIMKFREGEENLVKARVAAMPSEPTLSQEILAWSSEPQKPLSEEIMFRECEEEYNLGRQVKSMLNEYEVNLRERLTLGTLLLFEVLRQPPQSICLRLKHCVTLRKDVPQLIPMDFYVQFPPPGVVVEEEDTVDSVTESTSERENKTVIPPTPAEVEEARSKLLYIKAMIDNWIAWFEPPQAALWDPIHNYWSTEDVHDVVFEEETDFITCRVGRMGLMTLHVDRYINFPYEDWSFQWSDDVNDGECVKFYLKAAKVGLFFKIKPGKVCLEKIECPCAKAVQWLVGTFHTPEDLKTNMQRSGINVFPEPDTTFYVKMPSRKQVVLEKNIHLVWGLFSKTFRFKWSKFNQEAGTGNIVFQAQEYYKGHQVDFCLIHLAMCSCYVLDITEESKNYSSQPAPGMETCIDLYTLLNKYSTLNAKRQLDSTCTLLIQTITEFLNLVRPLSFS